MESERIVLCMFEKCEYCEKTIDQLCRVYYRGLCFCNTNCYQDWKENMISEKPILDNHAVCANSHCNSPFPKTWIQTGQAVRQGAYCFCSKKCYNIWHSEDCAEVALQPRAGSHTILPKIKASRFF